MVPPKTRFIRPILNYGLQFADTSDPNAYVLGGMFDLPKRIIEPSGDWSNFLPVYEPQFGGDWDTFGCTVWGTQNAIETHIKKLEGKEYNFSERFNYILAGIRPPGADPHEVMESMRKVGLIAQEFLPMTDTYEEFIKPDPMTKPLLKKGGKFPYLFRHAYVWQNVQTQEQQLAKVKEFLPTSPLNVSVTAWIKQDGVYVDNDQPNTHWCMLYGLASNGYKIFDSYDQSHKIISFDHKMQVCKRIVSDPKVANRPWLCEIIRRLWV